MTFQSTLAALQSTVESVTPSLQKQPTDDPTSDIPAHPDQLSGRSYIEIRPTETPVEPETVSRAMGVLRSILEDAIKNGLRYKVTGSTHQPVVEWLLVSDSRSDTSIRYLVGDGNINILPDIKNALRTALPNSYEFQEITWYPRRVHEHLPVPANEHATPSHPSINATAPYVAGVEYRGHAKRRSDWQTPLVPFDDVTLDTHGTRRQQQTQTESRRVPLATLVETMQEADIPIIYQAICRPYEDWTTRRHDYIEDLRTGTVTIVDKLVEVFSPRSREEQRAYDPPPADDTRIERISNGDPGRTLCVSARAAALARSSPGYANDIARTLATVFDQIGTEFHDVHGHLRTDDELHPGTEPPPGTQVLQDICNATCCDVAYETLWTALPLVSSTSRGIVVGTEELPNFCLLDGDGLTSDGKRAVGTRATERTGVPLPPPEILARYTGSGMALGMPLTHDRQPYGQELSLPAAYQDRHVFVGGDTGAGKSVLIENAMLTNAQATDRSVHARVGPTGAAGWGSPARDRREQTESRQTSSTSLSVAPATQAPTARSEPRGPSPRGRSISTTPKSLTRLDRTRVTSQ